MLPRILIILLVASISSISFANSAKKELVDLAFSDLPEPSHARTIKPVDKRKLKKIELDLWNSPEFRKQFAQSYIAETDIEPKVTIDEREQMQEVMEHISADEMDDAINLLLKYRNDASSATFDFTLANIYFQQEELEKAAKEYQVAVNKYPKFLRAWKNLGLIYVRQSEFEKALPALTKVVSLGGRDSITYGLLGFAYSSVGDSISAESAYRMAILLDSKTLDWKMGLAKSFFKQERFSEAIAVCNQLIEKNPDRADMWLLQANAYIGSKNTLKAAEIYELVDSMGKSSFESLNMLGDIYINEELYEMATKSYIRAMHLKPDHNPQRPIRSAKVLIARGALKETSSIIEKIEEIHGADLSTDYRKDLLKIKARLAVAQGYGDDEVKVLEEIVELDPLDGEALILLGQNSAHKSDTEKAIFYYERAASLEKYEADAKVRHAQLLVGNGKYSEALPLLKRAQMIKPRENIQKYLEQVERVAKGR